MPLKQLAWIHSEVLHLQRHVREFLASRRGEIDAVRPDYRKSAENLLAYTALRQLDLRKLQLELAQWGLSSLGRCEGHVLSSLDELQNRLEESLRQGGPAPAPRGASEELTWREAERRLHHHTRALLGERPAPRHVYIMVTAPDEAPDEAWCASLMAAGMSVLRINSAHGDPGSWRKTAEQARRAAARLGRPLRILVDLEGPKIRVAPVAPGPMVARFRPPKDTLGRVTQALRVLVLGASAPPPPSGAEPLWVPDAWIEQLQVGDAIHTRDSRERPRVFRVVEVTRGAAVVEVTRTTYLIPACTLSLRRGKRELGQAQVQGVRALEGHVEVGLGDELQLWLSPVPGEPGVRHPTLPGAWLSPPRVGVELGGVSIFLKPGHRVLIDDGKIETTVVAIDGLVATVKVVHAAGDRVKIRAEKGVNFPDSELRASALSPQDRAVLPEILPSTDALGISFVRTQADLNEALGFLQAQPGGDRAGVIVKLETAYALRSLPDLLLEAMRHYPVGVMIARGDLAVEVGFERLAEVQQEILWFCEAAHLPVIWATQVLDALARTGIPSRAEITDASMSVQAECVMLNKGPHVADACRTLDAILQKMEQHQYKRRTLYRPLRISLDSEPHPPAPSGVGEH